ncbi:plexin-B isoform X2 [Sitophilus oryzae]|uniref:Plexin-B isoform X2 n=1 Tax=Sitophilus oryzae TaxID=7048 RepID=A0A6J2XBN7_SITOR|nr:plexin-B isoform X2 [Sitophilus oryzae]
MVGTGRVAAASAAAWLWLVALVGAAGLRGPGPGPGSGPLLAQYPRAGEPQLRLSHMAIDYKTRRIYVAGVNVLLQLDTNLNLEHFVVTGPKNDSPLCHPKGCNDPEIPLSLMDNYNKVLLVEPESRALISCGSLYQGACHRYRLGNISADARFIPISIAANDANASTYAFIGPKSYNPWGRPNVLYVGTTFTNNGEYRHDVPAISSRDLDSLDFAEYSFSKQSLLSIDVKYRDHFIVQYIYGFNASDYAYFVIVQKQSHLPGQEEQGYVSRLARTCINDPNYDSYTEVTLQCVDADRKYNLVQDAKITAAGAELAAAMGIEVASPVLVAVFRPARGITNEPQNHSALCIYSLRDIENKFIENIHMCFNGSVKYRNMGYISGPVLDGKCPASGSAGNIPNFCGDVGLKISGVTPITTTAALTFTNVSLSAIATASTGRHVLAFLGTTDGYIKKVLLNGPSPPEYEQVLVDPGNPILPDTTLSPTGDYLYVLSGSKVSKINVEHCSTYTNCSTCLESKDPYCGWCSLEKRCTVRSACQKASHSAPRWLSLGTGQQCIDFEQVLPERIPINQMTTVRLTIRTLPELPYGAKYKCVFGSSDPIDAQVTEFGLSCPTPDVSRRPKIPPKMDHILVPLSVRSSETNKDFVSRNFAYYDCGRHATCGECVRSKWACNWCVYENKCTDNASVCQRNIISGENNPVALPNHGYAYCPQFKKRDVILLPNNVLKDIVFEVKNLPHPQAGHIGFQCIVVIEGATMLVPARVDNEKYIVCDKTTYSYEANEGEHEASVRVVWNRNHHIDSINVILYKCDILGSHREHADCSLCVTRNSKYNCTWCGNSCQYFETCMHVPHIECPRPRIDIIKPLSGPIEGGTLLTIEGSNLGLKQEDVQGKIRIGDVPCKLVNYEVSVRIQCVTGPSRREHTAPIVVGNEAGYTESSVEFSYQDIRLTGIYPAMGPQSGGTLLAISGKYLNIGSEITAYLDDNICAVNLTQASSGRLTCITSKAQSAANIYKLTLSIDGANRTLEGNPFNYTQDPTIMEIKPLNSFVSGGKMIFVHGTNLDSIQKPEMEVYSYHEPNVPINSTVCTVLSSTQMECPSPAVNRIFESYNSKSKRSLRKPEAIKMKEPKLSLKIGFVMDNVQSVRNLEKHFPNLRSSILYVEDPIFIEFPNQIKLYKGDTLVIEGENLNAASDEADVVVTIGTKPCNVTSLAMSQLVCSPPELQPSDTDEDGIKTDMNLPLVVVRVGKSLRFPIGYLKYDLYKTLAFPPEAIILIAVGVILFAFFSVAVVVVYRRKSTQAEREYKRIQIQMDTLESNVRSECKLAFAELQTDMTDLTADLENSGIPTLDHTTYIMKVFFPGVSDHPILNALKVRLNGPKTNYDAAMLQFEQLINNKYFILTFIDILENQKSFNIRNKVNVASLLMVVLMDKMEYATDILKCLLLRLIDKSVNTKYPQLMLRRTESVVEKMLTNWMALCMYHYLKEYAGSSLFLLFKAIKHQIEKGLVDAITHDARYSLSEERLLRENVEHSTVTLHIVQDDLDEKIQCKVLDCDTVSQVKSKILDALFKNTPFSLRPSIHEVDLVLIFPSEWRHGRGGHLTLQDEDLTTKTIGGWKKLNTLAHYGVKESAVMSLISRQNDSFNNCKQPCHTCVSGMYLNNSQTPIFAHTNGDVEAPNHPRVFHLIKPVEDHQFPNNKILERTHKAIPEIFLTRLLSTKGTIQKFVDDFFMTILTVNEALPPAVKWLFDLLDEAARKYGIQDPEVVYAWKSNSLPLRFWVNFIKNPDFIFDINKTNTLDSCLSVIAQTFMDACSTTEHRLGKDSPSNKLLFAKDIPRYRDMVAQFYSDVAMLPVITDQEMGSAMQQLSAQQAEEFDTMAALKELYMYVTKYRDPLLEALSTDPVCWRLNLAQKLDSVAYTLGGEETSGC